MSINNPRVFHSHPVMITRKDQEHKHFNSEKFSHPVPDEDEHDGGGGSKGDGDQDPDGGAKEGRLVPVVNLVGSEC